jgi:putative sterol carrier protein
MARFPTDDWLAALVEKLNTDPHYAEVARGWEGDMLFVIEPGGSFDQTRRFYLDLWHGKCRSGVVLSDSEETKAVFTLSVPYENAVRLLRKELDPMQALLTRKISVHGNIAVLMRNVPTVLDFVRCAREVTDSF